MAFFTRKGLAVPVLPGSGANATNNVGDVNADDGTAAAAAVNANMGAIPLPVQQPSTTTATTSMPNSSHHAQQQQQQHQHQQRPSTMHSTAAAAPKYADAIAQMSSMAATKADDVGATQTTNAVSPNAKDDGERFDYVVDRTYGVEV